MTYKLMPVAWRNPITGDVITVVRKQAWLTQFNAGEMNRAKAYTEALVHQSDAISWAEVKRQFKAARTAQLYLMSERDALRVALADLVALDDLKGTLQALRSDPYYVTEADRMEAKYEDRKPLVWDRARAVLAQQNMKDAK